MSHRILLCLRYGLRVCAMNIAKRLPDEVNAARAAAGNAGLDVPILDKLAEQLIERAGGRGKSLGARQLALPIADCQSHQTIFPDRTQKCDLHPSRSQTDGCSET